MPTAITSRSSGTWAIADVAPTDAPAVDALAPRAACSEHADSATTATDMTLVSKQAAKVLIEPQASDARRARQKVGASGVTAGQAESPTAHRPRAPGYACDRERAFCQSSVCVRPATLSPALWGRGTVAASVGDGRDHRGRKADPRSARSPLAYGDDHPDVTGHRRRLARMDDRHSPVRTPRDRCAARLVRASAAIAAAADRHQHSRCE